MDSHNFLYDIQATCFSPDGKLLSRQVTLPVPIIHLGGDRHSEGKVPLPITRCNDLGQGSNPDRSIRSAVANIGVHDIDISYEAYYKAALILVSIFSETRLYVY